MFLTDKDIDMFFKTFESTEGSKVPRYPLTDIGVCDDGSLVIQVACAGFDRDELDIEVKGNQLIISGEHRTDAGGIEWYQKHISELDFERVVVLHDDYVNGNVTATYDNGLLYIKVVPKEEDRKFITIE